MGQQGAADIRVPEALIADPIVAVAQHIRSVPRHPGDVDADPAGVEQRLRAGREADGARSPCIQTL